MDHPAPGIARLTKHLNFSAARTDAVFTNKLFAVATESWATFAALQSTIHEAWARKFSGTLETRLNYSPTDCFFNFPFPRNPASESALAVIGETYHEHRRALMRDLWLGLTDLYNLFHDPALTPELVTESRGDRATITGDEGFARIQRLRELHRELDQTVLTAYGWHTDSDFGPALALRHDFHPLDFLPENDRIRLTLHPEARREVLARLLKLNHQLAAAAVGVVAASFTADQRVRDMVLSVYVPIAPAVVWAVRECIRQRDAVSALAKLKVKIEGIFAEAISGKRGFHELDQLSRSIQDMIFDGRSRNPLFFNFLYNRLRPDHELQMNEKAKEMADAALAKQEQWK